MYNNTCYPLAVGCSVTNAMSVSFIHFVPICWRLVPRTCAEFKSIAKIPVPSSGSAESLRENLVAYLLLWSAVQRLAGARSRLYHNRLLLPKQHVSAFFKIDRVCVFPWGVHCSFRLPIIRFSLEAPTNPNMLENVEK